MSVRKPFGGKAAGSNGGDSGDFDDDFDYGLGDESGAGPIPSERSGAAGGMGDIDASNDPLLADPLQDEDFDAPLGAEDEPVIAPAAAGKGRRAKPPKPPKPGKVKLGKTPVGGEGEGADDPFASSKRSSRMTFNLMVAGFVLVAGGFIAWQSGILSSLLSPAQPRTAGGIGRNVDTSGADLARGTDAESPFGAAEPVLTDDVAATNEPVRSGPGLVIGGEVLEPAEAEQPAPLQAAPGGQVLGDSTRAPASEPPASEPVGNDPFGSAPAAPIAPQDIEGGLPPVVAQAPDSAPEPAPGMPFLPTRRAAPEAPPVPVQTTPVAPPEAPAPVEAAEEDPFGAPVPPSTLAVAPQVPAPVAPTPSDLPPAVAAPQPSAPEPTVAEESPLPTRDEATEAALLAAEEARVTAAQANSELLAMRDSVAAMRSDNRDLQMQVTALQQEVEAKERALEEARTAAEEAAAEQAAATPAPAPLAVAPAAPTPPAEEPTQVGRLQEKVAALEQQLETARNRAAEASVAPRLPPGNDIPASSASESGAQVAAAVPAPAAKPTPKPDSKPAAKPADKPRAEAKPAKKPAPRRSERPRRDAAAAAAPAQPAGLKLRSATTRSAFIEVPGQAQLAEVVPGQDVPGLGRIIAIRPAADGAWTVEGTAGSLRAPR